MVAEGKVKYYQSTMREFTIRSKLITLMYFAYLTIPIITLIIFEDAFNQLIENINSQQIEKSLIDKVVEYYTIYATSYATVLLIIAIGLILLVKTTSKLIYLFTENKSLPHNIVLMGSSIVILATSIYMYLSLPQLANSFRNELTSMVNSGNLGEISVSIPTILGTLTLISEISLRLAILTHGFKLYQLVEKNELLNFMKNGTILLIVGSILSLIEVFYIGIGLGSILILIGFYITGREKM